MFALKRKKEREREKERDDNEERGEKASFGFSVAKINLDLHFLLSKTKCEEYFYPTSRILDRKLQLHF